MMTPAEVALYLSTCKPQDLLAIRWLDSGKSYLDIEDADEDALSIVYSVGQFLSYKSGVILLSSCYDETECKFYGTGNAISDKVILAISRK